MKQICVFCGAAEGQNPSYMQLGVAVGKHLAQRKISLVYGGATVGVMGAVANAMLEEKQKVIGIIPKNLVSAEVAHYGITKLHIVENMHERKNMMYELSDGFLVLPGGMGTLDEMFEIITWGQLRMHQKPIFVLNHNGFFNHLLNHIHYAIREGFIKSEHLNLFKVLTALDQLEF